MQKRILVRKEDNEELKTMEQLVRRRRRGRNRPREVQRVRGTFFGHCYLTAKVETQMLQRLGLHHK